MTIGVHQYDWVIKKLLFDDTLKNWDKITPYRTSVSHRQTKISSD